MNDKIKNRIEQDFKAIQERLGVCPQMAQTDRRNELKKIEVSLIDLENAIQQLQKSANAKEHSTLEVYEERLSELSKLYKAIDTTDSRKGPIVDDGRRDENFNPMGPSQAQIMEGDSKLKEGKSRALAMLHTINNMREEINLIDDEIMLQREKLLVVNEKLKETQSVLKQTKRLVAFFSKAVYDDVFIKVMIGLIAVVLVVILGMSINIKIKKGRIEQLKKEKAQQLLGKPNFNEIDEQMFAKLNAHQKMKSQVVASVLGIKKELGDNSGLPGGVPIDKI